MARKRWPLTPLYPELTITHRQAECLITLLRHPCAEYRELAELLSISPQALDTHIQALYKVFDCKTRQQLRVQGLLVDWRQWDRR